MTQEPFPFTETGTTRVFSEKLNPEELLWHWDEQDRLITAQHDTDWMFQVDNELPFDLQKGISLFVAEGIWHRLIKGTGDLTLTVLKL